MTRLLKKTIITLVCIAGQGLSCFWTAFSQDTSGSWAVKAGADRMTIGSFRDSYTSLGFNAFTLEADYQTAGGYGGYQAGYNYPVFGIGLTWNTLSDVKFKSKNGSYSDMVTAYGTISRDLVRTNHLGFGYNIHLGLSYSSGYYDAQTNSANWFFSSPILFYAAGGGHLTWLVSPRLDLEAGIIVKHNSSARLAYPNGGLNYWGGGLSARYRFQSGKPQAGNIFRTPKISPEVYRKRWNFELYAGGGVHACAAEWRALVKTVPRNELSTSLLKKWPMASLSADAIYRISGRFGLGTTVDGFWCSNTGRLRWADSVLYEADEVASSKGYSPFSAGIGLVQEVFYRNAALYVQEGIYLYRHMGIRGEHGPLYERAGIRYYPPSLDPFFVSVCIKAHKFKADYLDFSIGIRL